MVTDVLLLFGVATAAVFLLVAFVEGARRPAYEPAYHTISELELGPRGWIQRANFLVMAAGVFAYSVGVQRALDAPWVAGLLAVFGLGLLVSGVFTPDPVRGYPSGAPTSGEVELSWHAKIHDAAGPVMFLALLGACLASLRQLSGGWRTYTIVTAAVGLAMTAWTAVSYQRDAAHTGLVQRGLLVVYWLWIGALGIHLVATT